MDPAVVAALRCPHCRGGLSLEGRSLRCGAGHAFDLARSGYVSFAVGRGARVGDPPEMVAARAAFLGAGHFDPLSDALAAVAAGTPGELAVEIGAGTARHLARVLDALPGFHGLALDASAAAARHAARAHPRISALVADARGPIPLAGAAAGLVLLAFAPRNGPELRRIVRPDGVLLLATPLPDHLAELRGAFDLLAVDPLKAQRTGAALSPGFERASSREVRWEMALSPGACAALVAMGPSAHHLAEGAIAGRAAALPATTRVTGACAVEAWRPR